MLRFLKKTSQSSGLNVGKRSSSGGSLRSQEEARDDPIPVQRLRDAQDLAAQLTPSSIPDGDVNMEMDDGLTQEDKMLAISMLDASGRTRTSNKAITWYVKAKLDEKGAPITPEFSCTYGWVCQTGFYPEDLNKKNQDNLYVETSFGKDPSRGLFGVFDGHGKAGTECSTFAVNNLSKNIKADPSFKAGLLDEAYVNAFIKTNEDMHAQKRLRKTSPKYFDDTHAGTTAICVMFDGNDILVANVGDSRAVVGRSKAGNLKAMPLSIDQTPYRKDERQRCQRAGAVVMTMDQLEGYKPYNPNSDDWGCEEDDDGDPPRLWLPNRGGPGVAFTRSLGDELAERIGCHAQPETIRQTLTADDQFIVIASDGVFEFLSSQQVVDMVAKFQDPVEAAQALVAEAYKLWLHYEVRTDDITAIVIHLKGLRRNTIVPEKKMKRTQFGSFRDMDDVLKLAKESRPVRREMSRKKREMIAAKFVDFSEDLDTPRTQVNKSATPKTDAEYEQISNAIRANFLFQHLNPAQLAKVLDAFEKTTVAAGDTVIKQGEQGDLFYVVGSGVYDCLVDDKLVHTYTGNPSFGELALMYSKPRAATVVAKTDGELWALDRLTFRKALIKRPNREIINALKQVPILVTLGRSQFQRLADILTEEQYEDGNMIITQGEMSDTFYVVKNGSVRCTINDGEKTGSDGKEVMRISKGGYFGERALLQSEPRAANVIAVGEVTCLYISRKAFEEVLGPLGEIIAAHSRARETEGLGLMQMAKAQEAETISNPNLGMLKSKGNIMQTALGMMRLVVCEQTGKVYTLKSMSRKKVEEEEETKQVLRNRHITLALTGENLHNNRTIVQLLGTFVGVESVHLLYKDTIIGDLGSFMTQKLSDEVTKFVCSNLVNLLEFLHGKLVVCRSVNAESLLVNLDGYVKLVDFSYCKMMEDSQDRTFTMCGAAAHLSPEMILNRGHSFASDWWSLGVLVYEMLAGTNPFQDENSDANDLFPAITSFTPSSLKFPESIALESCQQFITACLQPDEANRIGTAGTEELKKHSYLASVNFEQLQTQALESPLASASADAFDEIYSKERSEVDVEETNIAGDAWYAAF